MKDVVFWSSIIAASISACCGLYAGFVTTIRDNQDHFIADLQAQSQWAAYAAAAAGIAVALQALERLIK